MTTKKIGTREEWLAARLELLDAEKQLTRQSDQLAEQRQALPWVRVDKEFRFDTDEGEATLLDLFKGRSQLLIYHFMFGPDYVAGCPSCSSIADGFNGIAVHLANHDVMLQVARAHCRELQSPRAMGWMPPGTSRTATSTSISVGFTEEQQREAIEYNYRREPAMKSLAGARRTGCAGAKRWSADCRVDWHRRAGIHAGGPGMSVFVSTAASSST